MAPRGRQALLSLFVALTGTLCTAGGAQAVVVDMNAAGGSINAGNPSVNYTPASQSGYYGVALAQAPSASGTLASAGIPYVATTTPGCPDPWLTSDFSPFGLLPSGSLCAHSVTSNPPSTTQAGSVLPSTQTFVLTWDPQRRYWQTTRNYVQTFLSDVAAGSGTLTSPFSLTGQYGSPAGAASNRWRFGGGCIDYGSVGGASCQWGGASTPAGNGYDYNAPGPVWGSSATGCASAATGSNQWYEFPDGGWGPAPNDICITDSQIQAELQRMIPQTGLTSHVVPGFKPLIVLLTPPGVETCLDAGGNLCSANGGSTARFCSYHGQVSMQDGTEIPYVVQPWTASWDSSTDATIASEGCDDGYFLKNYIPTNPAPDNFTMAKDVGARLVSPLSQSMLAAETNPYLNAWFGANGAEINDNGCTNLQSPLDIATVGSSTQNPYYIQREFNNGGALASDPNALTCMPQTFLSATFVAPSAVNQGDEVQLDGSVTASTLLVPASGFSWNFGDGTPVAKGPSVVHSFAKAGTYTVTLNVTDRGGNQSSFTQTVIVLTANGQPAPPPGSGGGGGSGGGPSGGGTTPKPVPALHVRLLLLPEGIHRMLRSGLALRVSSNQSANGLVTVSISRAAARKAHMRVGRGASVVIGRGTVSQIANGTIVLHLHLSKRISGQLARLRHVDVTVRLALVPAIGRRLAVVVAGRY